MVNAVTTNPTTQTTASKDTKTLAANYETFLSLLTAQIRNQDPLSPMDTTEWTNQLVQYSSVEQQLKGNEYLEKISKALDSGQGGMDTAVAYIGKTVSAQTTTATLANGQAAWDYTLGGDATEVNLTVTDANGTVVWSGTAPEKGKGTHTVVWDGEAANGNKLTSGDYTLKISAKNNAGDVATAINLTGIANAAELRDGAVVLKVGGTYVPLSLITKVS